jgi:cephalosporin-C deacetylase-like acetyl esterase
MTSRRQFFQASSMALAALVPGAASAQIQTSLDSTAGDASRRDYWNDVPNYLIQRMNSARTKRKTELAELSSSAQAAKRLTLVRERVWELIGGKLERTPLNPVTRGTIERNAYRIEKVTFESQPEFYVTAHLYVPRSGKAPHPAILCAVGHAPEGKTYGSYQTLFQNLARQGFVVLTWDPPGQGERLQYIDPVTNQSTYGPTGEHDRFGWPALLIGSTTTQFEAWDGIRALDYLLTRPEVDSKRIGCCGHSGGGTQTMFLCALEPRIHVAVCVEGHTENLAGADYRPPGAFADAEQNLIGSLKTGLDRGDLLGAFAPKPLLICYTPIDAGTTYSPHYIAGTEEIVGELKSIYGLYGAAEKIALSSSTLPHDYDYFQRRSTYEWFNKWMLGEAHAPEEAALETAPASDLWCTSTGQVLTSLGGRAAFQLNYTRLRAGKPRFDDQLDNKQIRKDLHQILSLPSEIAPLHAVSLSNNKHLGVSIEEIEYESEPGIRVPGWFVKPFSGGSNFSVAVLIQDQGKDVLFDQWSLLESCAQAGVAICSVDLRTCGVTRPRLPAEGPSFYGYGVELAYSLVNLSLGAPIIGQQTWDLLRCLDYLGTRSDVNGKRIALCGTGTVGLSCIAAAALDDRFCSLLLNRTVVDLECIVASKEYQLPLSAVAFGMLKKFDLPDLCASIAPRPLWLVNTVGPTQNGLALSDVNERYGRVKRAYQSADRLGDFVLQVQPGSADGVIQHWLKTFT